jgi:outer membrane protein TolC
MTRTGIVARLTLSALFISGFWSVAAFAQAPNAGGGLSPSQVGDIDAGDVLESDGGLLMPALEAEVPTDAGVPRYTLPEAISRSLQQNPNMATALDEVYRAEALVREVRSTWFPTLYGNGSYTRLDRDRVQGNIVVLSKNELAANLTATVPVVSAQHWANWWHAKDNAEVIRVSAEDVRRTLATAVARAYLAVVSQKRILEVDVRAQVAARAHRDYAKARFEGGVGNRIDLVRAQQEIAADATAVESAQSGLVKAREALGVLVADEHPVDTTDEVSFSPPPSQQDALAQLQQLRLDLQASDLRAQAADRVVHDSWTDYMPLLSIAFAPFYQNPPTLTSPLTGWQAQVVLTVPFYDGGLRYGQLEERKALADEAHQSLAGNVRQARSDVRAAFLEVQHADAALVQAREAARLAHEALDLANKAYRAGAYTNIEVIDAERQALDADTQAAIAEDGARQARLDLLSASGHFP